MTSKFKTPFTGYYGMWSAVSKWFVFGIQEEHPWDARKQLRFKIGWDALKYRFRAKRIRDCANHRAMFYQDLTLNESFHKLIYQKQEETLMNIKITIDAPELASAIEKLATALGGMGASLPLPVVNNTQVAEKTPEVDEKALAEEAADKAAKAEAAAKKKAAEEKAKADKAKKDAAAKKKAEAEKAKKEAEESTSEPEISYEVVRGKLAEFAAEGKAQQVKIKEALTELGVSKLSDVKAEDFGQLLEVLGLSA